MTTATPTNVDVPVVRPPLMEDPRLNATIEELDLALGGGTADSYLAPPPLIARLAVPRSRGRWSEILPLESAASFDTGPISEANLGGLDEKLLDDSAQGEACAAPPPLMAQLPGPTRASARNTVSDWTVSVTLTAAGPPATIFMGVGIGTPSASTCAVISADSTITPASATAQL